MNMTFRGTSALPAPAIASALLWGIVEFIALQRASRSAPRSRSVVGPVHGAAAANGCNQAASPPAIAVSPAPTFPAMALPARTDTATN
jgi:hypothetical protein